jgi:hypothetical protein
MNNTLRENSWTGLCGYNPVISLLSFSLSASVPNSGDGALLS